MSNQTLKLGTDNIGLKFVGKAPDTSYARDLRALMQGAYVTGASFAFTIEADEWDELPDGRLLRTIVEVDRLFDVSVVYPFGAYAKASSELVRSLRAYASSREWSPASRPRHSPTSSGGAALKLKDKAAQARIRT